jgi:type VI secretion system protein ImpH
MAESHREKTRSIANEIAADPFKFDFFRAVRLLEANNPDRPRVGYAVRLEEDFLRFCQNPSLAFASSTLQGLKETEPDVYKLFVNFFGLFGPNGPLPQHLTEFARNRQRSHHDPTLVRFMDVFHHRMLSFFYRAWASGQKQVDFDRPPTSRFSDYYGSFFGIGMPSLRNRDSVPDHAKLFFTGHLLSHARNADGLQSIVQDYFNVPTQIREFIGFWIKIPEENQCKLGESPNTGMLGVNLIAGERKYETQLKFRIRLGPMGINDLRRLVPNTAAFKQMKDWVLNYINQEYFWDVQCVLKAEEVPSIQLGGGALLGWTSWLKSTPFTQDADDPIFDPELT